MTKSWLEKTMHTGEEVDAAQLIKSLHASRDALKIERDNALAENERLRAELEAARRDAQAWKGAVYACSINSSSVLDAVKWMCAYAREKGGTQPFDDIARGDK